MSNTSRLRDLSKKYLNNSCSKDELTELLNILKRADKEAEIKEILSQAWDHLSDNEHSDEELLQQDRDDWFDEIFQQAKKRDVVSVPEKLSKPSLNYRIVSKQKWPQWINVAVILVITVSVSIVYTLFNMETVEPVQEIDLEHRVAAPGEKIQLILSDGTQVNLNSGSRIEFPESFGNDRREVILDGEAYFIVNSDPERPFIVHSGEIITRVLGTSFNVRSYSAEEESVVAVTSGKVTVSESQSYFSAGERFETVLEANQWTSYRVNQHSFDTNSGDISLFTAWNHGVLYYMNDSLADVARNFELWYGVNIEFKTDAIKDCIIRGEHREETLRNVLESITYAFEGMSYEINGKNVVLSGKGCK